MCWEPTTFAVELDTHASKYFPIPSGAHYGLSGPSRVLNLFLSMQLNELY